MSPKQRFLTALPAGRVDRVPISLEGLDYRRAEDIDAVERAARAAFQGGPERRVFLTSAGPIGPLTDRMRTNYHRLIDVGQELSPL